MTKRDPLSVNQLVYNQTYNNDVERLMPMEGCICTTLQVCRWAYLSSTNKIPKVLATKTSIIYLQMIKLGTQYCFIDNSDFT